MSFLELYQYLFLQSIFTPSFNLCSFIVDFRLGNKTLCNVYYRQSRSYDTSQLNIVNIVVTFVCLRNGIVYDVSYTAWHAIHRQWNKSIDIRFIQDLKPEEGGRGSEPWVCQNSQFIKHGGKEVIWWRYIVCVIEWWILNKWHTL